MKAQSVFITTTGGELYSKLVKYLWKVENRLKWHFIFSRMIHVNLKDFSGQIISALKGLQCIFDIFKFQNSISIFQLILSKLSSEYSSN